VVVCWLCECQTLQTLPPFLCVRVLGGDGVGGCFLCSSAGPYCASPQPCPPEPGPRAQECSGDRHTALCESDCEQSSRSDDGGGEVGAWGLGLGMLWRFCLFVRRWSVASLRVKHQPRHRSATPQPTPTRHLRLRAQASMSTSWSRCSGTSPTRRGGAGTRGECVRVCVGAEVSSVCGG